DPRVSRCQRPTNLRAVVGRRVIEYQHSNVDAILRQHAFDARAEEPAVVVARHVDIDRSHGQPPYCKLSLVIPGGLPPTWPELGPAPGFEARGNGRPQIQRSGGP